MLCIMIKIFKYLLNTKKIFKISECYGTSNVIYQDYPNLTQSANRKFCRLILKHCVQCHCKQYHWPNIQNQRTNGPVNAHLISLLSKAQKIQNLENIWYRNYLDLQYSLTFINSVSCLHLPIFRSLAARVSEKSTVFTFSHRKA